MTYSQNVCLACYNFASRYKSAGSCGACGRIELLRSGYCRLCWVQAYLERPSGPNTPLAPYLLTVRYHQLFLAGMNRRKAAPKAIQRRPGVKGRPRKQPPPPAVRPSAGWIQPRLVDVGAFPSYRYGQHDLRTGPPPANPWLAWGLHLANVMAEVRGFGPSLARALNRTLVMLLAGYTEGEMIRASDFDEVLKSRGVGPAHTIEILGTMGILIDDRAQLFDPWLKAKLVQVSPAIAVEVARWVTAMHDGGPRTIARAPETARNYLRVLLAALTEWSLSYHHLREVTRDDVLAQLDSRKGQARQTLMVAFRSLFAWARKNGVIFTNPTGRITIGRTEYPVWQPLTDDQIAMTIKAVTTPHARVFVILAAVHAARPGAVRALQLSDIDLANRGITIASRTRPLDEPTHRVLIEWLDHRRRLWPNTANLHLMVSATSAVGLGPVSHVWANICLRGLPATLERLRIDRQLEEALNNGADPLQLAMVFEINETTAIRYALSARQLLPRPHEVELAGSDRTQVSDVLAGPGEHLGSF